MSPHTEGRAPLALQGTTLRGPRGRSELSQRAEPRALSRCSPCGDTARAPVSGAGLPWLHRRPTTCTNQLPAWLSEDGDLIALLVLSKRGADHGADLTISLRVMRPHACGRPRVPILAPTPLPLPNWKTGDREYAGGSEHGADLCLTDGGRAPPALQDTTRGGPRGRSELSPRAEPWALSRWSPYGDPARASISGAGLTPALPARQMPGDMGQPPGSPRAAA